MNQPDDAAAAPQGDAGLDLPGKSPPRPEVDAEQRLADVFELTNSVFARMHEGAMWQMGVTDAEEGWKIVRQRLKRLQRAQDMGRFTDRKSEAAHDR